MPVLADVVLTVDDVPAVHPSGEPVTRPLPGACATCRQCGHEARVVRGQSSDGSRIIAAGRESLRDLTARALEALAATCPRTTGPDPVQSWPNTYAAALIPSTVRVLVDYRGTELPAELVRKTLVTAVGPVARDRPVRLVCPNAAPNLETEVRELLERAGYVVETVRVSPSDPRLTGRVQPAAPAAPPPVQPAAPPSHPSPTAA